jgi:hypothetical protein
MECSVPQKLSAERPRLYDALIRYVQEEMNRADQIQGCLPTRLGSRSKFCGIGAVAAAAIPGRQIQGRIYNANKIRDF